MSAKKDKATEPRECYTMQLFGWEPVVYLDFNTAYKLMLSYMAMEDCVPSIASEQIMEKLNGPSRQAIVYGLDGGLKVEVSVIFRKLSLVTEVTDET